NPFRFSFDRQAGALWVGDVGQNAIEEIDIVTKGANLGWRNFEGTQPYDSSIPLGGGVPHTPPVYQYDHSLGAAIIGGYVYRGSRFASLFGRYLYTDYASGTVWAIDTNGQNNTVLTTASSPTSLGEDNAGELYVVSQNGRLYQLTETGGGGSQPVLLSQTGLFTNLANLTPASGLIEYDLNQPFWSDGALKRRWVAIPSAASVTFSPTGNWTFPIGTVIVKHFEIELTEGNPNSRRRLETRLLLRATNGDWLGFTYKWNVAETDADLLVTGQSENLTVNTTAGAVTWPYSYPSRSDCLQCHTNVANRALGLATRQLNRDFDYTATAVTDNQLRTLNHISYFSTNIGAATQYGAYPALDDTNASIASRARAYLAVNCAQCHQPGGPTPVNLDFRFDTADGSMNAIGVVPTAGELGLVNARIIARGAKASSVLWERMRRLDGNRMPPLGTHRVDQAAVDLIGEWIDRL
ncbi:MAG: PQQ-dependent sugar dehydrogenase, partial [Proteobacteria bacterium]|nr:PQQ-dependent sugar dehydrogenase [Pseudomonadota bacterium]